MLSFVVHIEKELIEIISTKQKKTLTYMLASSRSKPYISQHKAENIPLHNMIRGMPSALWFRMLPIYKLNHLTYI